MANARISSGLSSPGTGGCFHHYVPGLGVGLYEGTKRTMATDAVRRGLSERALQAFLGHRDVRSTRRYARLSDEALVSVPRPRAATPESDGSSCNCPAAWKPSSNHPIHNDKVASPTGFEPYRA